MFLRTLGALKLEGSAFTRPKPLLLLAYLSVEGPKDRRFLAELFWPRATDPLNRLSTSLARLRKVAPEAIKALDTRLSIHIDTDVQRLLSAVEANDGAMALTAYQGAFLEGVYLSDWGVELEEWVYQTREHLAERVRSVLLKHAENDAFRESYDRAARQAEIAYKLAGAATPGPEDLPRFYTLMLAGSSPYAGELRDEAEGYGIVLPASPEQAIRQLSEAGPARKDAAASNLPARTGTFIGRERELAKVIQLLSDKSDCRLVTLLGPGGIGKTHLALAAAHRLSGAFKHGTYFVSLAALHSADHIVTATAEAIGFQFTGAGEPREQLLAHLRSKELLLVLDNFESVLAGASLVTELLEKAPSVRFLVTSRERLNLTTEVVFMLSGMDYPKSGSSADPGSYDALKLLLQRARLARPDIELPASQQAHAIRICQLVQGMPLALVLAASWLHLLSFEEVANEIAANIDFLETEARDAPERQRSMRAAFDYSWQRLSADEQQVLIKLAVFRGGFTRQAAQAVADTGLTALRRLVEKSLLALTPNLRYEIHELIRQYAEQKLRCSGELDIVLDAHSNYFLRLLERSETDLKGARQLQTLDEIEADLENVRAAWNRAVATDNLAGLNASLDGLYLCFSARSRYSEGVKLLAAARQRLERQPEHRGSLIEGRMLARLGFFQIFSLSSTDAIARDLESSLTIARRHRVRKEVAFSLLRLGCYHSFVSHDYAKGARYLESGLKRYRCLDDRFYLTATLLWLGVCHSHAGNLHDASSSLRQALDLARSHGNYFSLSLILTFLSKIALCSGEYQAAEAYCEEARPIEEAMNQRLGIADIKSYLATLHLLRGNSALAHSVAEEALRLAEEINHPMAASRALAVLCLEAGTLGDADLARRLGEDSLAIPSDDVISIVLANWGLAVAYHGLGAWPLSWQHVRAALARARSFRSWAIATWVLPVAVANLLREGDLERATDLFKLSQKHAASPIGWMEAWPPLVALRTEFAAHAAGCAVTESGHDYRLLALEKVVQELMA